MKQLRWEIFFKSLVVAIAIFQMSVKSFSYKWRIEKKLQIVKSSLGSHVKPSISFSERKIISSDSWESWNVFFLCVWFKKFALDAKKTFKLRKSKERNEKFVNNEGEKEKKNYKLQWLCILLICITDENWERQWNLCVGLKCKPNVHTFWKIWINSLLTWMFSNRSTRWRKSLKIIESHFFFHHNSLAICAEEFSQLLTILLQTEIFLRACRNFYEEHFKLCLKNRNDL